MSGNIRNGVLTGKTIVVTATSLGPGRAIACACAREGAVIGLNEYGAEAEARALHASNPEQFRLMRFDMTEAPSVALSLEAFVKQEGCLYGWVNSGGIVPTDASLETDLDAIQAQINANLVGTIVCSRVALPHMIQRRQGVIVNVCSSAVEHPAAGEGTSVAATGKVEAFTRSLATQYARRNIRVVGIQLGPADTEIPKPPLSALGAEIAAPAPLRRTDVPKEVAEMTVYLLSERAQVFATGSVFTTGGGQMLGRFL